MLRLSTTANVIIKVAIFFYPLISMHTTEFLLFARTVDVNTSIQTTTDTSPWIDDHAIADSDTG